MGLVYLLSLVSLYDVPGEKQPSVSFDPRPSLYFHILSTQLIFLPYATGRVELRIFLIIYLITLPLQLITNGSLLQQGTTPLVALTAIHVGAVVALFWSLLANAIVATQIVEDGTLSSIVVRPFLSLSRLSELRFFESSSIVCGFRVEMRIVYPCLYL